MFAFFSKSGLKKFVSEAGYEQIEITGRHIYLILAGRAALAIAPLLEKLGFQRELRFRTKTWFWFLGGVFFPCQPMVDRYLDHNRTKN